MDLLEMDGPKAESPPQYPTTESRPASIAKEPRLKASRTARVSPL